MQQQFGIAALGFSIPKYTLPLAELANFRSVAPQQYIETLGCQQMSICGPNENVISLAITAAKRALDNWNRSIDDLGLIIVATETAVDMSRPLSSWVMSALGIKGNIRSYEVKHACYGGTAAIRQAIEWKLSGNAKNKAALVIAADVALYAEGHSGEPTQGAGAAAVIIDTPEIAEINRTSYYWSDPQFDFWRPVGAKYPEVNGRLSLSCYINAVNACFTQLAAKEQLADYLQEFAYLCFHVPFPKMVQKAVKHLGADAIYAKKCFPTMEWNQQIGNSYTASLWFAVANALSKTQAGQQLAAFSYGSGCGAELLTLHCNANQSNSDWLKQLQDDLNGRQTIDIQTYLEFRNNYFKEKP